MTTKSLVKSPDRPSAGGSSSRHSPHPLKTIRNICNRRVTRVASSYAYHYPDPLGKKMPTPMVMKGDANLSPDCE